MPNEITWKCSVCRENRPDSKISVAQATALGGSWTVNKKYCNDKPDCREKAQKIADKEAEELDK